MFNIFRLRRKYLNLEFRPDKKTRARVLECPGLWMTPVELDQLRTDLRSVVRTLGIGDLNYGILKGEKAAFDQAVITLIYDQASGVPHAFNALTLMSCLLRGKLVTVVHLGLVVVDPGYRAKGISWILYGFTTFLLFLKNRFKATWVSNVTQVPAIVGMVSESFGGVFPNPLENSRRTHDHLVLARQIMNDSREVFGGNPRAEFDEENFIIKDAYTAGSDNLRKTLATAPLHRNSVYNDFCQRVLDYDRGDDILQLGYMDVKTYYKYMVHQVPVGSRLIIFYKVFFSFFEVSLVPIFQWFSSEKQMGILRARKGRG